MAGKCSYCRAELPRMAAFCAVCGRTVRSLKLGMFVAGGVVVFYGVFAALMATGGGSSSGSSGGTVGPIAADLLPKQAQCRENVASLEELGVRFREGDGYTVAEYDEYVWAGFEHVDKVRQAALIYCAKMPDSGRYTVLIKGLHDGKTKASLVDGNYFDE